MDHVTTDSATGDAAAGRALRILSRAVASKRGQAFFEALVRGLGEAVDADYAFIARCNHREARHIDTLALWADGAIRDNARYDIAGTPCEEVYGKAMSVYERGVARLFPAATFLRDLGIEGYAGVPLADAEGTPLGVLGVMSRRPLDLPCALWPVMEIFAACAAQEVERRRDRATIAGMVDEVGQRNEELASSRRYMGLLLDSAAEGFLAFDAEGHCTLANAKALELLGLDAAEAALGRDLCHLTGCAPADDVSDQDCNPVAAITDGVGRKLEVRLNPPGRPAFDAELRINPVRDDRATIGAVATFEDITERKAVREGLEVTLDALTRSNAELERFAAVTSHDLREPVRSVVAYAQKIERALDRDLPADVRDYLGFMIAGAKRMDALVRDLMSYARLRHEDPPVHPVDLNRVVAASLDNLDVLIRESAADITVAPELPTVLGNPVQLGELVQNLTANAIKFARPGVAPRITIGAHPHAQPGEKVISVCDNGIGIEPQYYDQIFSVFKRLHSGDRIPGTGIGLAICKRVVERHRGRIWVDSSPGEGTTFYVALPVPPAMLAP